MLINKDGCLKKQQFQKGFIQKLSKKLLNRRSRQKTSIAPTVNNMEYGNIKKQLVHQL